MLAVTGHIDRKCALQARQLRTDETLKHPTCHKCNSLPPHAYENEIKSDHTH